MSAGESAAGAPRPAFLADVMLERLARWLRAAGVDVASADPTAPDGELRRRAAAEGRVLLTRDRRLADECAAAAPGAALGNSLGAAPPACHRVRAAAPLTQLAEVAGAFGLGPLALRFTRCLVCNAELRRASAAEVFAPPAAPAPADKPLWRCPACGRVYWEGSHTRRMRLALARALGDTLGDIRGDPRGTPSDDAHAAGGPAHAGHAPCSATAPHSPPPGEAPMSGSPNSSNPGTKAGRPAQDANHDVTARHGDDLAHGVRHSDDTDAGASARGTRTGEQDSNRHDPDDPASRHENISEA